MRSLTSFSVFAPASSANLGPGFDSLAVALDRWLRVDVVPADHGDIRDPGSLDLFGGTNLIVDAMRFTAEYLAVPLPACDLRVVSDIPVARGLGSSAAAIVAGIHATYVLTGVPFTASEAIAIGGQMESHADNVSAAVLGGVTVAVQTERGFVAEQLEAELPWTAVVYVPESPSLTKEARNVLPLAVPMADAAANVGRGIMLAYALRERNDHLLREAMRDRMHEPYRARIFPHLVPAVEAALSAGAVGACLSGAGPTIFAFSHVSTAEEVANAMSVASVRAGVPGHASVVPVIPNGAYVDIADADHVSPSSSR